MAACALVICVVAVGVGAQDGPPAPAPTIETRRAPGEDRAIAARLREIYAQVEGLAEVRVSVAAGVVGLEGEVLSTAAEERAIGIARQLQGVVDVQSELEVVRDLDRRLRPKLAELHERMLDAVAVAPLIAIALGVLALFAVAGWLLSAWEAPYRRLVRNRFLRDLLQGAVRAVVTLAGVFLALEILDATAVVAAMAGVAGLAGLAIGFAFRDLAENYIASILLSLRQPFLPNDHVVIEGHEGRVVRVTSRATVLIDLEGNHVRIPNALVFKGIMRNYSRNPRRRFDFTVGVATDVDLASAQALGVETLRGAPGVLTDPPPQGWVDALGDSNVVLHFFAWVDQHEAEWVKVRGQAIRLVKEAFDAAGVSMPEPIVTIRSVVPPAAGGEPERPAAPSPAVDVTLDTHLDREVAAERAAADAEDDLLDTKGPRE